MSPLSKIQKKDIAIAARRAYDAKLDREAFEAINSELSRTACFEAWRHVEQGKAVGVQSMRQMNQSHYGRVLAHFQKLGGEEAAASHTLARDADNGRRIARFKLSQALRERGLQEGYAAAICRNKFKCGLEEAGEKQLWKLVYDIRSRRPAKPKETPTNPF